MSPKRQRLIVLIACILLATAGLTLILRHFSDNLVYFYAPQDLQTRHVEPGTRIRLGGLVEEGSLSKDEAKRVLFRITDTVGSVEVEYEGLLPNLFREGQGVVAEGKFTADGRFRAETILAKHDERYMPPEVAEALKKSGRWKQE